MADTDLSKIVSLIMENPTLIEEIKALAKKGNDAPDEAISEAEREPDSETTFTPQAGATYEEKRSNGNSRRKNLLYAIKPYVSDERSRAIETMISIADILDMMKTR